jgi:hypothetical protein
MPLEDTRETVCGASGAVAQEDTDAVDRGVTNAAPGENGCSSREPAEEPGGGLSPPDVVIARLRDSIGGPGR